MIKYPLDIITIAPNTLQKAFKTKQHIVKWYVHQVAWTLHPWRRIDMLYCLLTSECTFDSDELNKETVHTGLTPTYMTSAVRGFLGLLSFDPWKWSVINLRDEPWFHDMFFFSWKRIYAKVHAYIVIILVTSTQGQITCLYIRVHKMRDIMTTIIFQCYQQVLC